VQAGPQPVDAAVHLGATGRIDPNQAGETGFGIVRINLAVPGDATHQIGGLHRTGEGDGAVMVGLGHRVVVSGCGSEFIQL
jgi:hypothetical protein